MQSHHVFESPERFVVGTVGEPGHREFFLQARADGQAVTVAVEKAEVAALAEGLTVLLSEVRKSGGPTPAHPDASLDRAPIEATDGEVEADFILDRLTVAWDGASVIIEAAATAPTIAFEDATSPLSDEEAADVAAVLAELDSDLDDVPVPDELDDLEQPVASLRVRLSLAQAASFISRAQDVVSAGRKPCALCGRPADAGGHFCPRLN